jgi:TolB-like protein
VSGFKRLVGEIHRRSIWQVLGIYLAGSWIALQVVEQLAEAAGMPAWIRPLALMLLIVGLPIVLATAFVQEGVGSAESPRAAAPASSDAGPVTSPAIPVSEGARRFFTWKHALSGGIIAFAALGVTAVGWVVFGPGPDTLIGGDATTSGRPSVAVLPFENLNADDETRFFAEGMHQDVIAQLSTVEDLTVIGRQSVLEYRDRDVDPGTVGKELSVATLVTASVRTSGDQVRVVATLIDVETEEQLWAETYTATLTDIFELQSDFASEIVAALASNLALPDAVRSDQRLTRSFEAYEHYLRGSQLLVLAQERLEYSAVDVAREQLEQAVAIDSAFAEAHALLAIAYDGLSDDAQFDVLFGFALGGTGRVEAVESARPGVLREQARRAAERALDLAPDLGEAQFAMWRVEERVGRDGLPYMERAIELRPGDATMVTEMALALRARGRWEEARAMARRATELNPRDAMAYMRLGEIERFMRLFDQSEASLEMAIRLAANDPEGLPDIMRERHWLELGRGGGTAAVQELFEDEQARGVSAPGRFRVRFTDTPEVLVGGEYDALVQSFSPDATDIVLRCTCYYQKAMMYRASGQMERARVYFDSLVSERDNSAPDFTNRAEQASWHTMQARDLARAGRAEEAREMIEETLTMTADTTLFDRFRLANIRRYRAMAYAELGDVDRAVEELEYLLSVPSAVTVYSLRDRQAWLPLRGNRTFDAFVQAKLAEAGAAPLPPEN